MRPMTSLPAFLLARLDEDEAHWGDPLLADPGRLERRILAECEVKRRLIDWAAPVVDWERVETDRPGVYDKRPVRHVNEDGEDVLRLLALPYADHPDYRAEWKP